MKKTRFLPVLMLFFASILALMQEPLEAKKKARDTFFETARFIMTREEEDIYKHLEGEKDKDQFIAEFWEKRDPDPSTEENESRDEFEKRINYAIKWFQETSKGYGWDTERGRLLLQLGFPDRREFGDAPITSTGGQLLTSKRIPMERWYYYSYQLVLTFLDTTDSGHLTLSPIPGNLLTALNLYKFSLDLREGYNVTKRAFTFKALYNKNELEIRLPVKKISFEEIAGTMNAEFHATVYVYRNNKRIDVLKMEKKCSWQKEELLKLKEITFTLPYPLTQKGKYYFDVVVEEIGSSFKFRDFVKHKI